VDFGIEAALPNGTWAAFGISNPNSTTGTMVGSNVVLTGQHTSFGLFATSYFITTRLQCNYGGDATSGVCPTATSNSTRSPDVTLRYAVIDPITKVRFIRYSRTLAASSEQQYAIDPNNEVPVIWAHGPLGEDPTRAVVLYHGPANHSATSLKLKLGSKRMECVKLNGLQGPSDDTPRLPPVILSDVTSFEVTTGSNLNYPNPPGWGLSYHINGKVCSWFSVWLR
jgi:hypothetical protein